LVDPLIVNTHKERKNVLIGGHQRLKIATMLGLKEIPCVEVELNPAKEKELNIRLNKNVGEWDWDALANYFDVGELTEWGFTDDELQFYEDEPTEGLIDDDEVPEVEEAITKQGDLWLLGEHRLLCGDATKKEDVDLLMDGVKIDMVLTDPPYGMNLDTDYSKMGESAQTHRPVIGDDCEFEYFDVGCKEQFWFGGDYYVQTLPKGGSWSVWDKYPNDQNDKRFGSAFEMIWSKQKHKRKLYRIASLNGTGHQKREDIVHPTQKPSDLLMAILNEYSSKDSIVWDGFLGSGSTLIACEKTKRKCYGMEIDPHYCDVIVKRWEEYTGNKAERIEAASA
jgi:DNA modification methylase